MIHFEPVTHTYTNLWGDLYTSSTQLVSKFKAPFDTLNIATAYSLKHGETPEYWIAQWADKRDSACERGTAFHEQQEQRILAMAQAAICGEKLHVVRNLKGVAAGGQDAEDLWGDPIATAIATLPPQATLPQAPAITDLRDLPDGLYCELLLWNHSCKIAGQADLVAIETDSFSGVRWFDIDDHKTNGRIDSEGFYSRATGRKMMLRPLAHLQDCNRTHYELQLSVYAWMLEQAGFRPRRMGFTHYPPAPAGGFNARQPPVKYPVEYLRKEVELMLEIAGSPIPAGH